MVAPGKASQSETPTPAFFPKKSSLFPKKTTFPKSSPVGRMPFPLFDNLTSPFRRMHYDLESNKLFLEVEGTRRRVSIDADAILSSYRSYKRFRPPPVSLDAEESVPSYDTTRRKMRFFPAHSPTGNNAPRWPIPASKRLHEGSS